ncbi:unnamed protein product [Symbiodinium natans]|uniref:Uncharacterized protein n=1 Tax=Symbiodinium natans TaxID=878477 RepID=A0A812V1M7_9DINO|nr:unnamed protein product [Symbiodinium natans]
MKPAADAENFQRASYKLAMKPEDIIDFMREIMPHLPLYVFKKDGQVLDATHSIDFHGKDLPLCHKKASKDPDGAVLLQLHWYDVDDPDAFCAETKVRQTSSIAVVGGPLPQCNALFTFMQNPGSRCASPQRNPVSIDFLTCSPALTCLTATKCQLSMLRNGPAYPYHPPICLWVSPQPHQACAP